MNSILNEISKLRKNEPLVIDYKNTNRYRVVANENDGSKTAYYFTSPIYNTKTRKVVDLKFHSRNNIAYATGSNTNITSAEKIRIENSEGYALITLDSPLYYKDEHHLANKNEKIYPTMNGIAIENFCRTDKTFNFFIEVSKPFLDVRANDKYFALMSERFRPYIVISCIGSTNINGNIIAPIKLAYQKLTDRKFAFTVVPCSPFAVSILLEINMYEPKLFQDTTVESNNPKINNAFGGIAFIGTTKEFGEQWLYARPDISKLSDLTDKKIFRATLHLPKLNESDVELITSRVSTRFCSFGSTWNNKVSELSQFAVSTVDDNYINVNLLSLFSDKRNIFSPNEGFILKAKKKGIGFSAFTTADSYYFPQILEFNYR